MATQPVSEAKRAANRRNAQKSTGPKTPEGKKRSSQNAIKHGLLAAQILTFDGDPNETTRDFNRLLDGLIHDFQPTDTQEKLLVERIAVCYWRLRRAYRCEAQSIRDLRNGPEGLAGQFLAAINPQPRDPFEHVLPGAATLNKILRYETAITRDLQRALDQFTRIRKDRQDTEPLFPLPDDEPTPAAEQPTTEYPKGGTGRLDAIAEREPSSLPVDAQEPPAPKPADTPAPPSPADSKTNPPADPRDQPGTPPNSRSEPQKLEFAAPQPTTQCAKRTHRTAPTQGRSPSSKARPATKPSALLTFSHSARVRDLQSIERTSPFPAAACPPGFSLLNSRLAVRGRSPHKKPPGIIRPKFPTP
jgi:hypothetical protein